MHVYRQCRHEQLKEPRCISSLSCSIILRQNDEGALRQAYCRLFLEGSAAVLPWLLLIMTSSSSSSLVLVTTQLIKCV